jgi:hypothetical protein
VGKMLPNVNQSMCLARSPPHMTLLPHLKHAVFSSYTWVGRSPCSRGSCKAARPLWPPSNRCSFKFLPQPSIALWSSAAFLAPKNQCLLLLLAPKNHSKSLSAIHYFENMTFRDIFQPQIWLRNMNLLFFSHFSAEEYLPRIGLQHRARKLFRCYC